VVDVVDGGAVVRRNVVEFAIGVTVRVLFGGRATTDHEVRWNLGRWQWW